MTDMMTDAEMDELLNQVARDEEERLFKYYLSVLHILEPELTVEAQSAFWDICTPEEKSQLIGGLIKRFPALRQSKCERKN
jgi:hypothetical protein